MSQELAALIARSDTEAQASQRIAEWAGRHAGSEAVALPIYRSSALSDLAGQMFVRVIEVPETRGSFDADPPAFLRMPFREAVEWFIDHYGSEEETRRILDAYRRRADEASRLFFDRVAERARAELQRTLEEGGTLSEFAEAIRSETSRLGIEAPHPSYVETVFRTNVQSAYGAGRYRQMTQPAVMTARPGVEFRAVMDKRTTKHICEPLDGKQWKITDPTWRRFSPPLHFNCRSAVVTLDADEIDDAAIRRRPKAEPEPEFDGPAAEVVERPIA